MSGPGIEGEQSFERGRGMKAVDLTGHGFGLSRVEMPHDFAVGGVEERDFTAVPIARSSKRTGGVTFGLLKNVLWRNAYFLSFDDSSSRPLTNNT